MILLKTQSLGDGLLTLSGLLLSCWAELAEFNALHRVQKANKKELAL